MDALLLGGTGRTGGRVLQQLLARGVRVRALVRSSARLPAGVADDPNLTVVEADLLSLSDEQVKEQVDGCDVVISCLGHTISAQGVFGQPRDLVTRSVERVCRAAEDLQPAQPVRLILMSSVSVNRAGGLDTRRGPLKKAALWTLRGLVPPARDNQGAADFLHDVIEPADPHVQWVVVRPDTLKDGDVTGVRGARGSRERPVPPRRDQHGQRRALHVRAGHGRRGVGDVARQASRDRERIAGVSAARLRPASPPR